MSNFVSAMKKTMDEEFNVSYTENGALGYRTSGKSLLDINFAVSSLRNASDAEIQRKFNLAFYEDKLMALKWLFFARDIRGGLGERRLFRIVLQHMAEQNPEIVKSILDLVPEYGRWDDLWCLLDTSLADHVLSLVKTQLESDRENMLSGKSISLLAKWMPRHNAHSETSRTYARMIMSYLGLTERNYRRLISQLNRYLDVVEIKMSENRWEDIEYSAVPSRANLRYNSAFLRHDEDRRRAFLGSVERGETKINAGTLFPHDIAHQYRGKYSADATLESLWNALPDTVQGCGNTIVVADGSGSMSIKVGGTKVSALEVANSLAIYFAERSSGQFKDNYITFSENPRLVDLSNGKTLHEKLCIARLYNEVANTNIEAVFNLILSTAIANRMKQEELPQNILIISDMEFDSCVTANCFRWHLIRPKKQLFKEFEDRYRNAGYLMPRLVFWNVNSRTGTIPIRENDLGVALVSGFSPNIVKMVMSNQTDPYLCLLETLNTPRYQAVEDRLPELQSLAKH